MAKPEKLLITGSRGQLGRDLVSILSQEYDVTGIGLKDADICDREAISSVVERVRPDVVLHTAALTDVDGCESEQERAMAVNAEGTRNVALACKSVSARMIYYSTDYVFDGSGDKPYAETDRTNPQTAYGKSKLAGEEAVITELQDAVIIRIAWVYGQYGKNFVRTMLKLGSEQLRATQRGEIAAPLRVVDDQFGNPTWTADIVHQTAAILKSDIRGVVHATSEGEVSWYGLAGDVFEITDQAVLLTPCTTADYPLPAPRPRRSSLENTCLKRLGLNLMRPYRTALQEFLIQGKAL